jgi:hypothetical protein
VERELTLGQTSLSELTARAAAAQEPCFTPASAPRLGGVDPLGLRQTNFELMDQVFPGLNNVARHIRPYVLVTWAWRRANQLAQNQGTRTISIDLLRDFVDRIEVIYVWSQFEADPSADLPGRRVLTKLLRAKEWIFGGTTWFQRRQTWRSSTALTAAVNYGPALKMLGWVQPHQEYPGILIPMPAALPALDAFEARIVDRLDHPAFSKFGRVTVTAAEVRRWSKAWALNSITKAEKDVMKEMLLGSNAPLCRQLGGELMFAAAKHAKTVDVDELRATMAGLPSSFKPATHLLEIWQAWRSLQVRQLFRLSLEALLYWILTVLGDTPKTTNALVNSFLDHLPGAMKYSTTWRWLAAANPRKFGPTELIGNVSHALDSSSIDLPQRIIGAIAFCLAEAPGEEDRFERADRLPLSRARLETQVRQNGAPKDFLHHVFESWTLAQHVYWSVGRALGDARSQGKTLLRLKVVLDEGGWALAPGVSAGSPPVPTQDRLNTMMTLAVECGLL